MYEQSDKGNTLTVESQKKKKRKEKKEEQKKINRVKVVKDRSGAGNTIRVEGVLLT